jgi:soluble lytic murein transglycosylase-like protein
MDSSIFTNSFQYSIYQMMIQMLEKMSESKSSSTSASSTSTSASTGSVSSSAKSSSSSSSSQATTSFSDLIDQASEKYGVAPALIEAVIKAESNFNSNAVSSAGAEGLMQLMPSTATSLGVTDSLDPSQNIEGGTKFLSKLLDHYDGNVELAVAAYNAGPGAVDSYDGIPPYQETQTYVKRVMEYYQSYLS